MKKTMKGLYVAAVILILSVSGNTRKAEASGAVVAEKGIADFGLGTASITIQGNPGQSLEGKEFQVYKLFHAENAKGMESIQYTVHPIFKEALQEVVGTRLRRAPETIAEYEIVDYMQTLNHNPVEGAATVKKEEGRYSGYRYFIEELRNEIVKRNLSGSLVKVAGTKSDNSVVISGLEYGYYLVDEVTPVNGMNAAASLCMVNTANPQMNVHVKADYPVIKKKIQEDDEREKIGNDGWNDIGDFEIGQRVPYQYESDIPDINGYKSYYYAWHDVMDEALTLDENSVRIMILEKENSLFRYELKSNEFTVTKGGQSGETFRAEIPDIKQIVDREFNKKDSNGENRYGQKVIFSYEAVLNDKAADDTGRAGFENDVRLEFSNDADGNHENSTGFTSWDTVVCFTYQIDGLKMNNHNQNLSGAKFRLYSDEDCKNEVYVKNVNGKYYVINRESAGGTVPKEAVEMISGENGKFQIYGVDSGIYYLKETEAPAGYRPLADAIVLQVNAEFTDERNNYVKGDGASDKTLQNLTAGAHVQSFFAGILKQEDMELVTDVEEGKVNLTVINTVGKKLPVTGSAAMFLFLIGGSLLMLYALIKGQRKNE